MYYLISDTLIEATIDECISSGKKYVAVLTPDEWRRDMERFQMGIDMEIERHFHTTKAEVNYDSLTGTFAVPDRQDLMESDHDFAFAMDERGIVLIDEEGYARKLVRHLYHTKKWRIPSLERFLYDFLESMIKGDSALLESLEDELSRTEDMILAGKASVEVLSRIADIRGDLLTLRTHYEQLIDLGQELAENENEFFQDNNIRYFDMFTARVHRLLDIVTTLRDYTVQVRELYQSQLAVKQNNTMTILTVVTTIFMPLTLIVGWYGMNFRYMPELDSPWGYPLVIVASLVIVIGSLIFFKMKKWL